MSIEKFVEDRIGALGSTIVGRVLSRATRFKAGYYPLTTGMDTLFAVDVAIEGHSEILFNVPITGNIELYLMDVGTAVRLARNASTGRFEVIGLSKKRPGTHVQMPVNLDTGLADATSNLEITSRPFTLQELQSYGGGFGAIPFGAIGYFRGSTLIDIKTYIAIVEIP